MELLRDSAAHKIKDSMDLGAIDLTGTTYHILNASASVEDANILAMIDSAPKEIPVVENYPSRIAFLRAKAKFELAKEYLDKRNSQ
jgi:hypothetical protein